MLNVTLSENAYRCTINLEINDINNISNLQQIDRIFHKNYLISTYERRLSKIS